MDLVFAAIAAGTFGPFLRNWRALQAEAIEHVVQAYAHIDAGYHVSMKPTPN